MAGRRAKSGSTRLFRGGIPGIGMSALRGGIKTNPFSGFTEVNIAG
ncbi:MAG: hypothetical protein ABII89_05495 [Candidatus Omnitrophota bacterium]